MRIAVTGASGFIGRHVLAELSGRQHEVIAVSRRIDGLPPIAGARWVTLDVSAPPADCYAALGRPDVLMHLAWGGLPDYRADRHLKVELPAHAAFLTAMVEQGLPSLLVTGTCLEYGRQSGRLDESLPCLPDTAYGIAKNRLLLHLSALKARIPFAFTWGRLFYTFGEGQNERSLWRQFDAAVRRGDGSFDMSGGEQLRDYLPVETVARHLVDLALHGSDAGIVNVCSGKSVPVRHLVEGWARDRGWQGKLNLGFYPYPDYEPMAFWGDAAKLKATLDLR
jgi:nucleoside-diphosphate-sugar epimerase